MRFCDRLRFLAAVQLLPALESGEETLVGGQAVLEGVMMRSPHAWGITVRKPSGELVSHAEPLERPSEQHQWMGWPLVRGIVTLGQAMMLGFRALRFSANVAIGEAESAPRDAEPQPVTGDEPLREAPSANKKSSGKKFEISGWVAAVNIIISVGFFIVAYKLIPLVVATELKRYSPVMRTQVGFNVVDGVIRIVLFLLFIWGTSLWKELRRVYQYHGAEHKTVFAFEAREPLTIPAAQRFSTFHPRCGTSFLLVVMVIAMLIYMVLPFHTFRARFAKDCAVAGDRRCGLRVHPICRQNRLEGCRLEVRCAPGLWLQRITTQPPSDGRLRPPFALEEPWNWRSSAAANW